MYFWQNIMDCWRLIVPISFINKIPAMGRLNYRKATDAILNDVFTMNPKEQTI